MGPVGNELPHGDRQRYEERTSQRSCSVNVDSVLLLPQDAPMPQPFSSEALSASLDDHIDGHVTDAGYRATVEEVGWPAFLV